MIWLRYSLLSAMTMNDGDKSLVVSDSTIVEVAERNMSGIVPLFYNMAKAAAEQISSQSIYNGLKAAYTGGNIGVISNDITKIWNSEYVNLDVIKWLCAENNFVIDYAKTLYKPTRPSDKKKIITKYTKVKTPHFFIYAKDKTKDQVEKINNSVVNRLEKLVPNARINFKAANIGKFDYKLLMNNPDVELDQRIIELYTELDLKKRFMDIKPDEDTPSNDNLYLYLDIRTQILEINSDIDHVSDVLTKYLYELKKSNHKTTLWSCFGDVLINNLQRNVSSFLPNRVQCSGCGTRIEYYKTRKYCEDCSKEIKKEQRRIADLKYKRRKKAIKIANPVSLDI